MTRQRTHGVWDALAEEEAVVLRQEVSSLLAMVNYSVLTVSMGNR
jgi:hypothetical protein